MVFKSWNTFKQASVLQIRVKLLAFSLALDSSWFDDSVSGASISSTFIWISSTLAVDFTGFLGMIVGSVFFFTQKPLREQGETSLKLFAQSQKFVMETDKQVTLCCNFLVSHRSNYIVQQYAKMKNSFD